MGKRLGPALPVAPDLALDTPRIHGTGGHATVPEAPLQLIAEQDIRQLGVWVLAVPMAGGEQQQSATVDTKENGNVLLEVVEELGRVLEEGKAVGDAGHVDNACLALHQARLQRPSQQVVPEVVDLMHGCEASSSAPALGTPVGTDLAEAADAVTVPWLVRVRSSVVDEDVDRDLPVVDLLGKGPD